MSISDSYQTFNFSHQIREDRTPEKPLIVVRIRLIEAIIELNSREFRLKQ